VEGWGILPEDFGAGVRRASGNPYPIQTKIFDFPYPISDLTLNLIPYFKPDPNPISVA